DLEAVALHLNARHDARMGEAEETRDESPRRRIHEIVRLHAGQHEVVRHRANRRLEETRDLADVVRGRFVERDPDDLVRSLRERLAQHLLRALRACGQRDDATSAFLLEPDALIARILVLAFTLVVAHVSLYTRPLASI